MADNMPSNEQEYCHNLPEYEPDEANSLDNLTPSPQFIALRTELAIMKKECREHCSAHKAADASHEQFHTWAHKEL
ncbi:hypothetical protein E8E11_010060 [Didymella keratinophila]|nr:hypothetical protein E8E11_010060 [Didymella keratinophila]